MPAGTLQSPPTNAFGLFQYLAQRLPGYDPSEYLRELNSAYIHVWEEVTKLKNNWFTALKTVTVVRAQFEYDLMFNSDGGLVSALSPRLYEVTRVRVQGSNGGLFQTTIPSHPNDPDFVSIAANPSSNPTSSGPYYWYLTGRNSIRFPLPLAIGTTIEVTYTFWPIALTYMSPGSVSSSGTTVTGSGTNFTGMVQPDFASQLPSGQPAQPAQSQILLRDSGGNVWSIGVAINGQLQSTKLGPGPAPATPTLLNDAATNTTTWLLAITTGGLLTTTSQVFSATQPSSLPLFAPNLATWLLEVNSTGNLLTTFLPPGNQEQIQAELVCNPTAQGGGQIYRVLSILGDTALLTQTPIAPVLAPSSVYVLATLPEIPREHIRVIAAIAMQKMYSIDGDDTRSAEWTGIAEKNIVMMKDSLMERQSQAPPKKQRFPFSILRARNRAWIS